MSYSYDRRKTAAKLDVYSEWLKIVRKSREVEEKAFSALLKKLSNYLISVGYDLDVRRSFIGKEHHGSDGVRLSGQLVITERPENVSKGETPEQVRKWIEMATGLHSYPKPGKAQYEWVVDISDY